MPCRTSPNGRGQPVDEVDGDRDVVLAGQGLGGVDAGRPGTDDGDAQRAIRGREEAYRRRTRACILTRPGRAHQIRGAKTLHGDQLQASLRSSPSDDVLRERDRGRSGTSAGFGSRSGVGLSDVEPGQPARQLGEVAVVAGTRPTIWLHWPSVRVEADLGRRER